MKNKTNHLKKEDKVIFALLYAIVFFLLALALTLELACPGCGDLVSFLSGLL